MTSRTSRQPSGSAPWGVIGHDRIVTLLRRHLNLKTVNHAYLFLGPPAIGKRFLALRFAEAILCRNRRDGDACGSCEDCRRSAASTHPEEHLLAPGDDQRLTIESIRELLHRLSLRTFSAGRRVVILSNAQTLTTEAANALLKTLEEPPEGTTLLLTSDDEAGTPPTIRSRCVTLRCTTVSPEALVAALVGRGESPSDARRYTRESYGRPGVALTLAEDEPEREARAELRQTVRRLLTGTIAERLAETETFFRGSHANEAKKLATTFVEAATEVTRELALAASPSAPLVSFLDALSALQRDLNRNAQPRLALESALIRLPERLTV